MPALVGAPAPSVRRPAADTTLRNTGDRNEGARGAELKNHRPIHGSHLTEMDELIQFKSISDVTLSAADQNPTLSLLRSGKQIRRGAGGEM